MAKIIRISESKGRQLYDALESSLRSLRRKSISYTITTYSNDLATIRLSVTGRNGTSTKDVIVKYDSLLGWQAYYENNKHYMGSLSELSTISRKLIQRMSIILRRI